jgi:hypothetical protein
MGGTKVMVWAGWIQADDSWAELADDVSRGKLWRRTETQNLKKDAQTLQILGEHSFNLSEPNSETFISLGDNIDVESIYDILI